MPGTVLLASPRGMCGGVRRALRIVEAEIVGGTVYVLHEIVHNNFIVRRLTGRGVRFVDRLEEVPPGGTLIFSAHGVARAVEEAARKRGLRVVDATCPLVREIHRAAASGVAAGALVVLVGHAGHPEVEGTLGQAPPGTIRLVETPEAVAALPEPAPDREVRMLAQTTLDVEVVERMRLALARRFPRLREESGICYATRERQAAVRRLAERAELVLVIGSPRSSNSNRLCEVAIACGRRARLIDDPETLTAAEVADCAVVGVTAGASAPDELVDRLLGRLRAFGFQTESD